MRSMIKMRTMNDLGSLVISSVIFLIVCLILSLIIDLNFFLGVLIGFAGSVFWLLSLYRDIVLSVKDGKIKRIRLGYSLRLLIAGILLFLSSRISLTAFFGTFVGLLNTKVSILISVIFRKGR
ncbi:MAG TPA: hypothetical protein ENF81_10185 [Thermotogaceae bacterium]|nr:ATP synthase subunit I [Thermotogota bacterium]HEW92886.1 hypothetical protein [Thermotogaceae bacterium]